MNLISRLFGSSLGKKYVMAITGCLLFFFVVVHLLGTLQIFIGQEQLNAYGKLLHSAPEVVWGARLGLLGIVALHIFSAIRLAAENKQARPVAYQNYQVGTATYAARTMLMSGLIVLAFVIYHLLHFTVQASAINLIGTEQLPGGSFAGLRDGEGRHDVFNMVVIGFSNIWVSLFYVVSIGLLCLHLSHGLGAMFQSLGWKRKQPYGDFLDRAAPVVAGLIFLGYASIPVAILLGYGKS